MEGMLEGKAVLVTGAAGGIGRASALLFSREGARVAVSDLTRDGADETARIIREAGGDALAVAADLREAGSVRSLFDQVFSTFGRLHGAFNNAGITGGQIGQGGRATADWDDDAFDRIWQVNARGTWLCMKAEIRHMVEQGGGSIVNTASLAGITGFPTTTGYAASKHAVVGMTKTASLEYAPTVRVNALCPGYIDTSMLTDTMSRRGEHILQQIPFRRLGSPEEMAEMVCWLLSDRSAYATGGTFEVDGGYMAG